MKICLVGLENLPVLAPEFKRFYFGGEQVQQTLLAKALVRRGHDVRMVVGDYGQPDGAIWEEIQTVKAYRFDAGIPVVRFLHPRWTKTWAALRCADSDIYYTSCAGMLVGLMALFCQQHRRGLVFRLASDSDADPGRVMIRYRRDKILYAYGLRRAASLLAQHEQQQQHLARNYGVQSRVAGMFVENPNRELPLDRKDIDVLWVSNLQPVKRPDLILELARLLPHRRVHIIGGRMETDSGLFDEICEKANAFPNVTFHGAVPYRDVGSFFDRAILFVNTSTVEGFPNTYLQSWQRGVPVVAFFDPGGLIRCEGLGVVVQTLEEMAVSVEALLQNEQNRQLIAQRGRAYLLQRYDDEAVLKPYLEAFETANAAVRKRV